MKLVVFQAFFNLACGPLAGGDVFEDLNHYERIKKDFEQVDVVARVEVLDLRPDKYRRRLVVHIFKGKAIERFKGDIETGGEVTFGLHADEPRKDNPIGADWIVFLNDTPPEHRKKKQFIALDWSIRKSNPEILDQLRTLSASSLDE